MREGDRVISHFENWFACPSPCPQIHNDSYLSPTPPHPSLIHLHAGVQVQVHRSPSSPSRVSARIHSAEQLSMSQLLELYADNTGLNGEVLQTAREALKVCDVNGCDMTL